MKESILTLVTSISRSLDPVYHDPIEQQQVAWWILQAILKKTEAELLVHKDIQLTHQERTTLDEWLYKHIKEQMPLQYLLGSVPFDSVEILIRPPILIPRPETEEWCVNLIKKLDKLYQESLTILDLCTGSGCIAIALAKNLKKSTIYATDINPKALQIAQENCVYNNITNVLLVQSDLYQKLPISIKFDCIVSNPPYLSQEEWYHLDPMVRNWEDKAALVADKQGLAIIEKIIKKAATYLKPNKQFKLLNIPQLIIEIDYQQANIVKKLMENSFFNSVEIIKDLEGKDRIVMGRL